MLTCAVCGQQFWSLSNTHLRKHGLTPAKYQSLYGGPVTSLETRARHSTVDVDSLVGLGRRPDSVVAQESGVGRRAVSYIRSKLGIAAFVGLILTQEEKPCRSIYEAMYDAWLHWKGKCHRHEVKVDGLPYIADFWVDESYVEIIGMLPYERYARKFKEKHAAYDRCCIPCQWIEPGSVEYLYRSCPVKLKFREQRKCSECGLEIHDLVQGMCRRCHRKAWGKANATEATCQQCGQTYQRYAGQPNAKFCSRSCYWDSFRIPTPSWDWIDEQLASRSVSDVAKEIGLKSQTLAQRLHRRRHSLAR